MRPLFSALVLLALAATAQAQSDVLRDARLRLAADEPAVAAALLEGHPAARQPDGGFTLALAYQALARHAAADSAFAHADTSQPRVLAAWARTLESLGRHRDARARLATAHARDTTNASIALAYARMLSDGNDWRGAQGVYARLLRPDSSNAYLLARLGYVYYRLERPLDAIVHYERALQVNPMDKGSVLALTKVYLDSDAPISARRTVDRVIDLHAEDPDVWRRKGEIGVRLEQYDYALDGYRRAVALGDTAASTLRGLGAAHYLAHNYPAADSALRRAYRTDSTDALNAYYLGMTRFALEDFPGALHFLNRTTTLMDQALLGEVHAQIGAVYAEQQQDRDAIAAYRLARTLDPSRADFLYQLAGLYERYYRDPSSARDAYEQFLRVSDPEALAEQRRYAEERLRAMREAAHMRGEWVK